MTRISRLKRLKQNYELLLMILPGALFLLVFSYLPMYGITLAFQEFNYKQGLFGSPFVGLENFKYLFMTDTAWRITANTLFLNALFIITGMAASIAIALLLFDITRKWAVKLYQSVLIFPRMLSWVVIGYMFYGIMSPQYGLLNALLSGLGLERVDWYSRAELWPGILTVANIWVGAGMSSVLYYATLVGIEKDYFDAAAVDGASKWQIMRNVTIPFLYPVMTLLLILAIGSIIRADFGMFYNLTRNVPTLYATTDVIDTYVFRALNSIGRPGMAAAAGFYQSAAGFVLIVVTNALVRKYSPENSLY